MSNKIFTQVPVPKFPSNTFSLSRSVGFNPRLQYLYCPNVIETIPGDGFNERSEQYARTQPMVAPTFAKMNADQHAFFVPAWQLNEHFDDFITGGDDGSYQDKMPYVTVSDIYNTVYSLLSILETSGQEFQDYIENETWTASQYNEMLTYVQNIIEHCDLLRAVPFVLPDFILIPEDATSAEAADIFEGNVNAFETLNGDLDGADLRVNLMPFAAYVKVWSEFFRDENLCEDIWKIYFTQPRDNYSVPFYRMTGRQYPIDLIDSGDFTISEGSEWVEYAYILNVFFGLQKRAWKKDYFTAALPFTQKGPDVLLPLSGVFPVNFSTDAASASDAVTAFSNAQKKVDLRMGSLASDPPIKGSVDLSTAGLGSTIVDVRRAFALEEFYEADGRGGNRYPENTLIQFGVRTPDSRLPRAQFLGSNSTPVTISEVVQTSSTDGTSPQGNLAGKGQSYGNNRLCRMYFTMHGFLLNFYSIRTTAMYEQGVHPMFSRFDRTEYAWPRFAHLGEQPVYTKELFVDPTVKEDEVFGYEPRYSEYKSEKSSVHHLLKGSLNFWTMSRRFKNKPVLNEEFIYNSPRLDNFAVVNPLQSPFIVEIDYRVRANRLLPFFGVPMI